MDRGRRRVLAALGAAGIAALAGCGADGGADPGTSPGDEPGGTTAPGTPTETATPTTTLTPTRTAERPTTRTTITERSPARRAAVTAADGDAGDRSGSAVALSSAGARALVGAVGSDDGEGKPAGAAYVFE